VNTPTLTGMPPRITKAIERKRFSLLKRVRKAAESDPALAQIAGQLSELWSTGYDQLKRRELDYAKERENGEVCWTVFVPENHQVRAYVRTPLRTWQELFYSWGNHFVLVESIVGTDPWAHLERTMNQAWNDERRAPIAA
jgi:hypothetical protein